jgi:outer membrane protein assembly factor BamB
VCACDFYYFTDELFSAGATPQTTIREGHVLAFDVASCRAGRPACAPLWKATTPAFVNGMSIANGVVYVSTWDGTGLKAYDAAGTVGCSGTPKVCNPITALVPAGIPGNAVIVNGKLYFTTTSDILYAYEPA